VAASLTASAQGLVQVYAAGSLRLPLTAIAQDFERKSPARVKLTFGASGLLRDRIAAGEAADVFASANMEHPEALAQRGWAASVVPFARNEMCVLARSSVPVSPGNVLPVMLDRRWKLGTSTPKADPSGDYAWEIFARADAIKPGSFAILDAKALKLTDGPESPPPPADRSVYTMLVARGDADLFLTYCTNAKLAAGEAPSLKAVALPNALRIGATYGLAVKRGASAEARAFAEFVRSKEGVARLVEYGFAPP
jgi:ABC-type molybdate transport system substrate-binding protein